jgi:hypothetical protein
MYLLVQACQHLWPVLCDDACGSSPGLTLPRAAGPQPPWCWQSQHRLTPLLPSYRMRVRCAEGSAPPRCQGRTPREETAGRTAGVSTPFRKSNTVAATPSCRTRTTQHGGCRAPAFLDWTSNDFGIIYALAPLAERRPFLAGRSLRTKDEPQWIVVQNYSTTYSPSFHIQVVYKRFINSNI